MENLSADATPFSFPNDHNVETAEIPPPEEDKEKEDKPKRNKKKINEDSSSSSSDSEEDDGKQKSPAYPSMVFNINKAKNIHIGPSYSQTRILKCYNRDNVYSKDDYDVPNNDRKGPKPKEELCQSKRKVNNEDLYIIAENISTDWMKLARFLPPRPVFSDGELKTFLHDNPQNLVEGIVQMLKTWNQRHPTHATIGNLAITLWEIGKVNISEKLNP